MIAILSSPRTTGKPLMLFVAVYLVIVIVGENHTFDNAFGVRQRTANSQGLNPMRTGPYMKLPQPNTTYATGQPGNIPESRFPDDSSNGPF